MSEPKPQAKPVQKQETDPFKIVKPLLTENEGYKEKAYWDKVGKRWTIGNGLTYYPNGTKVKQGDTITKELNDKYVDLVLKERFDKLSKYPNWSKLNPNQQATLLDFSYNTGANWNTKDNEKLILGLTKPDKIATLPAVMASYRLADGQVSEGLVNRRERANKLFNTPYIPPAPVQQPVKPLAFSEAPLSELMIRGADGLPTLDTRPSNA
ncbi:COG3772 Phage-related lysozyme (muraminidase) [uncultured Caudovirales phage]|uniref:Lysozyme n=1 Tax=uncultured Caudovirales phage TaxID=2100421 RepID=A0A6J7WCG6_9CAUD|nr:COG3772 Phage-related lysozyme (muraminidase) [uncultured Caudovirales phage]